MYCIDTVHGVCLFLYVYRNIYVCIHNPFTCTCFDGIPAEMGLSFSKNEFMTLAKIVLYLSSCRSFVTLQIQHSVGHDNFPGGSAMPP